MISIFRYILKRLFLWLFDLACLPIASRHYLLSRNALLRLIGVRLCDSRVNEAFFLYDGRRFRVGFRCNIGAFFRVWDFSEINIGNDLLISNNVTIIAGSHEVDTYKFKESPVSIGDRCWIGANVTIIGPVVIGDDVVIGAGSLVIRDIPNNTVCFGVPCRVSRTR
jgi:maltose O-acetyltransferase